jgi:hypothetical protein
VQGWTKDARQDEKKAAQAKAWDLWLDCLSEREIAKLLDRDHTTIGDWVGDFRRTAEFHQPPESRQHFDVWQFHKADDAGAQSYFGARKELTMKALIEKAVTEFVEQAEAETER